MAHLLTSLLQSTRRYWTQGTKVSSGTHPLSSTPHSAEAATAGPPVDLPESILNRSQILYLCKSRHDAAMNSVVCITLSESPPRHQGNILHAPFQCGQMTDTWHIHLHGWRGNDTTAKAHHKRCNGIKIPSWSDEHCQSWTVFCSMSSRMARSGWGTTDSELRNTDPNANTKSITRKGRLRALLSPWIVNSTRIASTHGCTVPSSWDLAPDRREARLGPPPHRLASGWEGTQESCPLGPAHHTTLFSPSRELGLSSTQRFWCLPPTHFNGF